MPERGESSECPTPPDLRRYLHAVEFPVGRDELLEHVESAGAPEDVRQALEALEPQDFESVEAVQRAVEALSR